jgi:MFS family permease
MVALSVAVYDHTGSAVAVAAMLVAGQVIPAFAVPALIARVEASTRRRELSALYIFEAVATTALAFVLWSFWLPAVLLLVALDGTAALAASALLRTAAAKAAREDHRESLPAGSAAPDEGGEHEAEQRANAVINVAFSATFVLGPVLGGAIVSGAGASVALLIDAASFAACGLLLLDLHPHVEEAGGESVRARLRAARDYIMGARSLRALMLAQAVALVFFESAAPIEVAYAKSTLGAGARGYGLLIAAWGVGVVVGSIIFARSKRGLGTMISAGTFMVGLAYIGFAGAPSLAVACAAAVVGGIGNGIQWAPLVSAIQRLTPPSLHGRVMGAMESIGAISPAIGLTLGGVLVAVSSPRTAFLVVGTGAALTTIAFARIPIGSAAARSTGPPGDEPGGPTITATEAGVAQAGQEPSGEPALS